MTVMEYLKSAVKSDSSLQSIIKLLNDGYSLHVRCAACDMGMLLKPDMKAGPNGELLCKECE